MPTRSRRYILACFSIPVLQTSLRMARQRSPRLHPRGQASPDRETRFAVTVILGSIWVSENAGTCLITRSTASSSDGRCSMSRTRHALTCSPHYSRTPLGWAAEAHSEITPDCSPIRASCSLRCGMSFERGDCPRCRLVGRSRVWPRGRRRKRALTCPAPAQVDERSSLIAPSATHRFIRAVPPLEYANSSFATTATLSFAEPKLLVVSSALLVK